MMTTSYKVLGVPMQRQSARRKLVVITYAVLAILCGSTFVLHFVYGQNALLPYSFALYGALAVGIFIFGGIAGPGGRWGLIKPFANKPPRADLPMVTLVKLNLQPLSAGTPDESTWRNDERELGVRDHAHYQAYQAVFIGVLVILLLAFLSVKPSHIVSAVVLLNLLFMAALVTMVLAITLPSAIILWTEPDVDLG